MLACCCRLSSSRSCPRRKYRTEPGDLATAARQAMACVENELVVVVSRRVAPAPCACSRSRVDNRDSVSRVAAWKVGDGEHERRMLHTATSGRPSLGCGEAGPELTRREAVRLIGLDTFREHDTA